MISESELNKIMREKHIKSYKVLINQENLKDAIVFDNFNDYSRFIDENNVSALFYEYTYMNGDNAIN